jgi:hypothetical protein
LRKRENAKKKTQKRKSSENAKKRERGKTFVLSFFYFIGCYRFLSLLRFRCEAAKKKQRRSSSEEAAKKKQRRSSSEEAAKKITTTIFDFCIMNLFLSLSLFLDFFFIYKF